MSSIDMGILDAKQSDVTRQTVRLYVLKKQ